MSNSTGDMAKGDAQPCDMVRGVAQPFDMPRSDHPPFDMTRYVTQSSEMARGAYQPFDMAKGAHQNYEMSRGVAHPFEMRGVAPPFDMPRTVPQTYEVARGVNQAFEMSRGVTPQYDMSRGVTQPFDMARGNATYDMPRGPQGYEMPRTQTYEMPRTQPYEMGRLGTQNVDMGRNTMALPHHYDYTKAYQQCPADPQVPGLPKGDLPQHMGEPQVQQTLEVPMEMPKTAPQPTLKTKGNTQKGTGHPFDFAKGYAQQLEMAKKAAQSAIHAKLQAQKAEKAKEEAEQAEKAKRQAEETEIAKQKEAEKMSTVGQPSEIMKLYAQQLKMVKKTTKPSEIAKMYVKQLELAKSNTRKLEKTKKSGPFMERARRVKMGTRSAGKTNCASHLVGRQDGGGTVCSSRSAQTADKMEDMDTDEAGDKEEEESKGDPPPFEMAKYLAQLSKMTKGGAPPPEKDNSSQIDEGKVEPEEPDLGKGDSPLSAVEAAKAAGLPFPLEIMKNLGLPFGMGIPGVGGTRPKRDRQELTIANKAKLIEQVESRGAKKKADIAREWGLRPSTLSTIMKNKDKILTQFKSQRYAAGRRRMRTAAYPDVEEALLTWFRYARAASIPITGPVLQGMGVTLAQELGHPEFSCSVGWLDRFKARHGLSFNPKNNQEAGGGTFNEPVDRPLSPVPPAPPEQGSDSETSPSSWFPPSMPAVEAGAAADGSANGWFPSELPNLSSNSTAETQEQLNKWFPAALDPDPTEEEEEPAAPEPSEDATSTWYYDTVPSLLKDNKPQDIFSAHEAALFYNLLPDRSLAMKGEDGHKWTWVKERLTLMVAVNMDGSEKLPLLVLGQMKDPKALYNVDSLPLPYEAIDSAMMTSSIFENWVRQLDEQFQAVNRNILLLVDTCPAHGNIDNLSNVQLEFLPTDTTTNLQPLDHGIIQSLKANYRRSVLEKWIESKESGEEYEVTLLEALELLQSAWKRVKTELIVSSFKQVGLEPLQDPYGVSRQDGEDEHALLERARRSGIDIPGEVTFESYLNVDSQVQTTMEQGEGSATDQEQVLTEGDEGVHEPTIPSEALHALATLRKFMNERSGPQQFLEYLTDMENWVANHIVKPEVSFMSE